MRKAEEATCLLHEEETREGTLKMIKTCGKNVKRKNCEKRKVFKDTP